jgi:bifunctional non-homologous end joining protein LigD
MWSPMLATSSGQVPAGGQWAHEVKWDGIRLLAQCRRGAATILTTRNGNDVTANWPAIAETPWQGPDAVLDGELMALNERGVPDFRQLRRGGPASYVVFDVLALDGHDLTGDAGLPWRDRRRLLEDLAGSMPWQVPPVYDDGPALLEATRQQGLEGVVSKRRDSLYRQGVRSPDWVKRVHRTRASYLVGGWRPQVGTTERLGALLVGEPTPEGLMYRGRVGSGIGARQAAQLAELLTPAETSPFADEVPRVDRAGAHWTAPVLVVDVETHGTGYQRLRQPAYVGVRSDLGAEDL